METAPRCALYVDSKKPIKRRFDEMVIKCIFACDGNVINIYGVRACRGSPRDAHALVRCIVVIHWRVSCVGRLRLIIPVSTNVRVIC